jgi:hypothetical protein
LGKRKNKPKLGKRWRRRLGRLATGGSIAAVIAGIVFLVVYGQIGGGKGSEFVPQIAETPSDASKGEPFRGGPRLYFPVESMDLGQVPLSVQIPFDVQLANVGDAALTVEDVSVNILEGCCPTNLMPTMESTTVQPSDRGTISFVVHMDPGMEGAHLFEISVRSNDAVEPLQKLYVKASWP